MQKIPIPLITYARSKWGLFESTVAPKFRSYLHLLEFESHISSIWSGISNRITIQKLWEFIWRCLSLQLKVKFVKDLKNQFQRFANILANINHLGPLACKNIVSSSKSSL